MPLRLMLLLMKMIRMEQFSLILSLILGTSIPIVTNAFLINSCMKPWSAACLPFQRKKPLAFVLNIGMVVSFMKPLKRWA